MSMLLYKTSFGNSCIVGQVLAIQMFQIIIIIIIIVRQDQDTRILVTYQICARMASSQSSTTQNNASISSLQYVYMKI